MSEVVWSIAGSDSGGGAGIQADLKAMHSFGVHGCTVITALTAQNSLGVEAINPVSNAVIESQLNALAQDMPAKVIKIGLLANIAQVELIAEHIAHYKVPTYYRFVTEYPMTITGKIQKYKIIEQMKEELGL